MGYPFYQTCKTLLEATDNCWIEQIKNMKDMLIFSKETVVAFTGAKKVTQSAQKDWQDYLKNLPRPKVAEVNYIFENLGQTCYYPVKGDVDYLVSLSDKKDNMIKGADYVVASYLTTDYLQPHIRIERGAYGSALLMKGTYQLLYTYRDPNYQSSLEIIEKINETDSLLSEQKFYSAKAGALSSLQKQFAVNENGLIKSAMLQRLFLQGRKIQDVKKYQKEIVALSLKDFQKSLEEVTTALNTKSIAVGTQKTDGIRPMADKVYYFDLNVF
jgi:Zn-dependent M16 (insulinase) family peptidase